MAAMVKQSFAKFWNSALGCCYDVIDAPGIGNDASLRPNQIFAVSLPQSLLSPEEQKAVVDVCARRLVTSHGLRSLAQGESGYQGRYGGAPRERDGASPRDGVGLANGTVRLSPPAGVAVGEANHLAWPRDSKRDL